MKHALNCLSILLTTALIAILMCIGIVNQADATQYGTGNGYYNNTIQSGKWDVSQYRSYAWTIGYKKTAGVRVQQDRMLGGYNVEEHTGPAQKELSAEVSGGGATISDFAWIY
ncbi:MULTISPECIES: hypothetical protein [unclassified Bifidobacterium]|uniref:hypothetical protein n=1 Tax=unclassified Bifidobacterium TaxID=2608897 RepID=UPI00112785C5|nr:MULTISPECIES: hypothetical protein [unclassified Bifidobacterium]